MQPLIFPRPQTPHIVAGTGPRGKPELAPAYPVIVSPGIIPDSVPLRKESAVCSPSQHVQLTPTVPSCYPGSWAGEMQPSIPLPGSSVSSRRARHKPVDPWLLTSALLALIPAFAIIKPGLPATADGLVHLWRALEVTRLLQAGILYPRWAPDFYLGYGYPFFNFYAPGVHLAVGLLALSGLGVLRAYVAIQVIALFLYPTGAYLAARAIYPAAPNTSGGQRSAAAPAALLASALYLYAPLRWRELFIQGNLSQLVALALLPWCAWALARATRRPRSHWVALAGLLLAALVYLHHPSAFLAFPLLLVYGLQLAIVGGAARGLRHLLQGVLAVGLAFILGIALSAPFWLPSLLELPAVGIGSIEIGMFNVHLNLLSLDELLSPAVLLDRSALNPPMPNSLGSAQLLLALPGLLLAITWARGRRRAALAEAGTAPVDDGGWGRHQAGLALACVAVLLLICVLMMIPLSAALWDRLPLARLIAFPWRLLGPALLWSALLGGAALFAVHSHLRTIILVLLLVLVPLSTAPYLFPRPFAPAHEPVVGDLTRYELNGGAKGTASANEYLPIWVQDPDPPPVMTEDLMAGHTPSLLDARQLPVDSRVASLRDAPYEHVYWLDLPSTSPVQLRQFFFPGWHAELDGLPAAIVLGGKYGLMEVVVPAGPHVLSVGFGTTPSRQAGGLAALVALLVVMAMMAWEYRRKREADPPLGPRHARERGDWAVLLAAATILALTGIKLWLVEPGTDWFRLSSPVASPDGMRAALHAQFVNGIELIGYSLRQDDVRQGGVVELRLYWQALKPQSANIRPFLHLDAPTGEVTWANETKLNAGDKPSSGWPVGFYVVDDYRLALPVDTPAVLAALQVGLLDAGGERVRLSDGRDQITVTPLRVREQRPLRAGALPASRQEYRFGPMIRLVGHATTLANDGTDLDVTLYWQASAPVPANYTVFVHVLDGSGQSLGQQDGPPMGGWYPSAAWEPGQVIADRHHISLSAPVPPGDVRLAVGLYTLADGTRQPAFDSTGARQSDDQIILALSAP